MFNKFQLSTRAADFLAKEKVGSTAALVLLKMMYHINRVNIVIGTPKDISAMYKITLGDIFFALSRSHFHGVTRQSTSSCPSPMLPATVSAPGDRSRPDVRQAPLSGGDHPRHRFP